MKLCKIENCGKKYHAKGFCSYHYKNFKKHGDPLFNKFWPAYKNKLCKIKGCGKPFNAKGFAPAIIRDKE